VAVTAPEPSAEDGEPIGEPNAAAIPAARLVFSDEDRAAVLAMVDEALRTGSLTLGPRTAELERLFAERQGVTHAVAVASGTSALEIVLRAQGSAGAEVVVPTNTFFATAAAVLHAGGTPRLADVDPATLALSVDSIEETLTSRTTGVVVVHIGGLVTPEMDAIRRLCDQRGLWLVEDAAHAHGSRVGGRPAGSFGTASAFSFYPTKVVTSGEGGMIATADDGIRDEALVYRDQGKSGFLGGDHVRLGYAWRMSELHAAVGLVQLARLDEFIAARTRAAAIYDVGLAQLESIAPLPVPDGCRTNYYKYVALLDRAVDRSEFKRRMRDDHGVTCSGEVYAVPLHRQPVFAELAARQGAGFPVADDVCARMVCLPVHSDMTVPEAERVVKAVSAVLAAPGVGG